MPTARTIDLGDNTEIVISPDYITVGMGKLRYSTWCAYEEYNLKNAEELGYQRNRYGVFACLAERQAFHVLVARFVFKDKDSLVLQDDAGRRVELPRWKKLYSESIVIALQYYLNTHIVLPPLDPWLVVVLNNKTLADTARCIRELIDLAPLLPIEERQRKVKVK